MKRVAGLSKLSAMWKHVPNILTFIRLGMTFIFLGMILYSPHVANHSFFLDVAFAIFVVAGLTDVIDGHVARHFNASSKFGRMIDPLVDKVLVCGAFICFAIIGVPKLFDWDPTTLAIVHWLVVGVLVLRETYVTVLRQMAEARGINFAAVISGKIKMFVQTFAIGTVIIKTAHVPDALWGQWFTLITFAAMIAITVYSGLDATRRTKAVQS
ncbi:MAG: CDP-alcohol phosphatidyltransferase family protein [Planctomycetaceae bacterium]|nr:MAG: CDP-alcohol phosphatidyltransferase family protein [Planctomycetaceae bacterium]